MTKQNTFAFCGVRALDHIHTNKSVRGSLAICSLYFNGSVHFVSKNFNINTQ